MMQTGPRGVLGAAGASGETPRQSSDCGGEVGECQGECGGQEASTGGKTEVIG